MADILMDEYVLERDEKRRVVRAIVIVDDSEIVDKGVVAKG